MSARPFALLAAVVLAACAAETESEDDADATADAVTEDLRPELAQMNDVSVLLPLGALQSHLTPASAGRDGELIPKAVYEKAFGAPGTLLHGGTPAAPALAGLKLVAFRFDPCFAHVGAMTAQTQCKNQLRLVFQTLSVESGETVAKDEAVHVFYDLSRDELKSGLERVVALRRRAAGDTRRLGPLGVHPIVQSQGLEGEMARGLSQIVLSLAGASNLSRITEFTTSGLGTAWNFAGVEVDGADTTPIAIPTVPEGTKTVAFFTGFNAGDLTGEPAFVPVSSAPARDNLQLLGNSERAARASAAERQSAFDAIVRIEDPHLHSPDTIDCASCHVAQPVRTMIGSTKFRLSGPNTFSPNARYVPAADLAQAATSLTDVNVHMFSYKGATPGVHRRTIQENAATVAYVNANILGR